MDAQPVREHVQRLGEFGLGWQRIAALAGVSGFPVARLLYGVPSEGRAPSKRIKTQTAEKLLAVRPDLDVLAGTAMIHSAGTQRRIQALCVVGWSLSEQARRAGRHPSNYAMFLTRPRVTAANARDVRDLCAKLWNVAPPETTRNERISAAKARAAARRNQWLPLAAWDDDLIDLPPQWLRAELDQRAAQMSDAETQSSRTAVYKHGDHSPLTLAGAREHGRRQRRKQAAS
ncbi:hypothetical protein ABT340_41395 [Streptosporangium sp. NPDC000239]|uniref:hypothetical protein n=1 Tax=Streptosporangium sp. NPDC000239 TaxID=3154248 RepID=UPI003333EC53